MYSDYQDKYKEIDFWIDKKTDLPAKMKAIGLEDDTGVESDIYTIKLTGSKVNKKLSRKTFDFKIPKDFNLHEEPLEKKVLVD